MPELKCSGLATDLDFRHTAPPLLAEQLLHSRHQTLATFAHVEAALGHRQLAVPYRETLNPPLWELGHVGWFQAYWLERNPEWLRGLAADPSCPRHPARPVPVAGSGAPCNANATAGADALYNSSTVPHATRWHLPLPDAAATRAELEATLDQSLHLLHSAAQLTDGQPDRALYFHRLCLAHEDMHHEAAVYMAQALGIALPSAQLQHQPLPAPAAPLQVPAQTFMLGASPEPGFAFDNECGMQAHALSTCAIDSQVLRWRDFLPFVEDGGYAQSRWWPGRANVWRLAGGLTAPLYLRRGDAGAPAFGPGVGAEPWRQWRHGRWQVLNLDEPACHLTLFEAEAWCLWADRRLPTEAEWQWAAQTHPDRFHWGAVWEWTASPFTPYTGFVAHPYRDYSAPWFGTRRVLRGASMATQPRMRHVQYRNFFTPERNDIFSGFRTCSC
jgi:gamma-glutamyl hercynylcysteine S-oxide synthase